MVGRLHKISEHGNCGQRTILQSKEQDQTFQDGKRGTERVQTKLGKTHVDYWYSKMFKRTFLGRDEAEVEVPCWQARMKYQGRVMFFNLQTNRRAKR
jgi:hypothetical protein